MSGDRGLLSIDIDQMSDGTPVTYRVLATSRAFHPGFRGGGPVRSLEKILDSCPAHVEVMLVTSDRDLGTSDPYPGLSGRWVRHRGALVHYLRVGDVRNWVRLARQLRARRIDLLYVNSLWSLFSQVPVLAAAVGLLPVRSILLAPRGELSPGALRLKAGKKRLFLLFWAPLLKRLRVRWQACSDLEARHIAARFPWARIIVHGQGTSLPDDARPPQDRPDGPLRLVFISRISPMKNLDLALAGLHKVTRPVNFDIFGPLEDQAYWARCQRLMAGMPANVTVRYRGTLPPEQVIRTFGEYDAFLLPTRGENFGHVILESLAASCPLICSGETPWNDLIEAGGGTIVRPLTADAVAAGVERFAALSPTDRRRARDHAAEAFGAWRGQQRSTNLFEEVRLLG
ncbi:glycosyltransferase family 4 protein [Micromonospora sp. 4G55]|uniref:glycosyltransferase family 4 protein n=1 Tax=Micromonospora sp. 4G55 TaxID=2806102 RepID=UPI001A5FC48B|nr:glycosyltransferase [Micromonospora sp. 4G55]MBM0255915.1 glycosyltransferase [Micromonospora sp. 4G55]